MTIKNIFKIHPLYYIVGFLCFITGNFKLFIVFSAIIIVHELGHLVPAFLFKWKIEKVILLPFGGITIFNEKIHKPLKQEFIITIMGPIFQVLFFFLLGKNNSLFYDCNTAILLFNLLPICPLDGSKIVNIISNKLTSYYYSNLGSILLSYILWSILFVLLMFQKQLTLLILFLFLLKEIVLETKKQKYYFHKFLLERYLNQFSFKREKIIYCEKQMCKEKRHVFYEKGKYITEREKLRKMFDKQG